MSNQRKLIFFYGSQATYNERKRQSFHITFIRYACARILFLDRWKINFVFNVPHTKVFYSSLWTIHTLWLNPITEGLGIVWVQTVFDHFLAEIAALYAIMLVCLLVGLSLATSFKKCSTVIRCSEKDREAVIIQNW